jgi:hypothetical protein
MPATTDPQPARLTIDYPDRELDRISTLLAQLVHDGCRPGAARKMSADPTPKTSRPRVGMRWRTAHSPDE